MRRILLAEDDVAMRAWIAELLRPHADVEEVGDGNEVLQRLANDGPYDLVITDVRMPWPSGMQVVSMARTAGLSTPFIVITAFPDARLRGALGTLPDAWLLPKPFSRREILDLTRRVVERGG